MLFEISVQPLESLLLPSPTAGRKSCQYCPPFLALMFSVNRRILKEGHKAERVTQASMTSNMLPRYTMGNVCRKSPPTTTVTPPKGRLLCLMSLRSISTASKAVLATMEWSKSKERRKVFSSDRGFRLELSLLSLMFSLKSELTVRPPGKRFAAIPVQAVHCILPLSPFMISYYK